MRSSTPMDPEVTVYRFPHEFRYKGVDKMRAKYGTFFEDTPNLHCQIKNRMVIGNMVIDEELVTANDRQFSAVAIYEVDHGKIKKVTFIP